VRLFAIPRAALRRAQSSLQRHEFLEPVSGELIALTSGNADSCGILMLGVGFRC